VEEADYQGWTPLMQAARRGRVEAIEALLEYGGDREVRRPADGRTALDYARAAGFPDAAEALQ
jgi:ankyrin repeat protein